MRAFVQRMWYDEAGAAGAALRTALRPAAAVYGAVTRARNAAYAAELMPAARARVPVISIGNIVVGGAGKTPVTAWLARRLAAAGHTAAVLHGGYGADEPALHRAWNPDTAVYVGRDRVASARAATAAGASVLLLDDGFQHRRLDRNVDLVLVPAESWTAAPRLLPAGPWREPPAALRRATVIAVTHRAASAAEVQVAIDGVRAAAPDVPVIVLALRSDRWRSGIASLVSADGAAHAASAPDGPVLAVTSIALPRLFVENARAAGADVDDLLAFPDHHEYDEADATEIARRAAGRSIVTTAKDWVKLRARLDPAMVHVLEQRVELEQGSDTLATLLPAVGAWP